MKTRRDERINYYFRFFIFGAVPKTAVIPINIRCGDTDVYTVVNFSFNANWRDRIQRILNE